LSIRHTATGATVKATIRKMLTVGGKIQMWSTAGTPGWEDLTVANWANYILTMTETPASSYGYVGSWPATLTASGWYVVDFYDGATIAGTLAGTFLGYWDGTSFGLGGADVRQIAGTAQTANDNSADINDILADTGELQTLWTTGGAMDLLLKDVPSTAEFNARTIASADYFVVSDYVAIGSPMQAGNVTVGGYASNQGPLYLLTGGTYALVVDANGKVAVPDTQKVDVNTVKARAVTDVGSGQTVYLGTTAWSTLTQTQISGGTYDLTNATYVAALKSGLGTVPASGNWNTVTPDAAGTLAGLIGAKGGLPQLDAANGLQIIGFGGAAVIISASTFTGAFTEAVLANGPGGGTGLNAQQTRNALKLAPSTGTPAAGSVDAELDAIKVKTDSIGSGRVTYASTVAEAALATIWAGDDYADADGTEFSITVTDYAGPSLTTATAKLRIMDSEQYLSAVAGVSTEADLEVAATITIDGTTITLAADLTAAQTAALDTSPPAAARNYVYEFICTLANTHVGYRTHGQMTVKKAVS